MSELVREILIAAAPETVFEFLTVPDKHVLWSGTEADLEPRPGGRYRVLMAGTHQAAGRFVEVVPNEKVVFTFGWDQPDHPIPAGSTEVEIRLFPEGDATRVRLVHRGLPDDAVADHGGGWTRSLDRLAVAAAGGTNQPDTVPGN